MIRLSLAAGCALALMGGGALAQTTGTALAIPKNVKPAPVTGSGPAGSAPGPEADADPWESFNRKSYNFSMALDRAAIGPVARTYKRAVPKTVRGGLHNMVQNLSEPVVFANDVLQGRVVSAAGTAVRFVVNSVAGIGGMMDVADRAKIPRHDNGFGVTLGRWGVKPGPYLYVPVLGPTTIRDGVGTGLDSFLSPFTYARFPGDTVLGVTSTVVGGVDLRANVDDDLRELENTATDPYATIRSAYLQNKQAQISGGDTQIQTLPDFPDEPGASPGGTVSADPFAVPSTAPGGAAQPRSPRSAPNGGALPDFPDNPPNPTPPADAPTSGLSGLY